MGGKVSKAKRACVTENNISVSGNKLTGTYNRKIDTECVRDILSSNGK